jgi:hypothetical protein
MEQHDRDPGLAAEFEYLEDYPFDDVKSKGHAQRFNQTTYSDLEEDDDLEEAFRAEELHGNVRVTG